MLFGAVVGTYELRRPSQDEEVRQSVDHVGRVELPVDTDHQRLLRELVNDIEDAIGAAVMRAVLNEVVGPAAADGHRSRR